MKVYFHLTLFFVHRNYAIIIYMLRINQELLEIEQAIDELVTCFLQLEEVDRYKKVKLAVESNQELQDLIKIFQEKQADFQEVKDYAQFRPEVGDLRRQVYQLKRQIDLNKDVVQLRQAEVALQEILAHISQYLSQAVSEEIFVDTGLPLAAHKPHHDKGRGKNIKEGGQK